MILHQFPDLRWLKQQAENSFDAGKDWSGRALPERGWPNVVLNVTTERTLRDNIRGPLSVFTNLSGTSFVEADGRRVRVPEGSFFLTTQGQYYTLSIEGQKTETFNVHFGDRFAGRICQALSAPEKLLDSQDPPRGFLEFPNRLYRKGSDFSNALQRISRAESPLALEESMAQIMELLLRERTADTRRKSALPVVKNSTREEIFRRLSVAADFIHSHFDRDITLDELAAACCLSKFHCLRLFKIAFGKTPHQYLVDVRMNRAMGLLRQKHISIHDISAMVGMADSSSFSRMFRRYAGVYPTTFRSQV